MKPLLFLDVDGVINVRGDTPLCEFVGKFEGLYQIHLPRGLERRITTIAENFEVVWATTWMERAHPYYQKFLDLPPEPWPCIAPFDYGIKLPQICDYAGERPFAWVDDEAHNQIRMLAQHSPHDEKDDWEVEPGIIIAPLWTEGLNDQHVAQLLAWAKEQDAG